MMERSDKSFFSFGGGRQGTAIAVMLARHTEVFEKIKYPIPQHIIFADTGREPQNVYENVNRIKDMMIEAGYTFHIVSKGKIGDTKRSKTLMPLYTRPANSSKSEIGMLTRQCTQEYKIDPIRNKIRELLGLKKGQRVPKGTLVETWLGISIDEIRRAKPSRVKWEVCRFPLIDLKLDASNCIAYVEKELGYSPPKSACDICPMRSPSAWQNLATEDPETFTKAVEFDREIRHGLTRNPAYIHQWGIPLEEAVNTGQLSLFPKNRSGSCDSGYCFN